jgi:hypothetical protein
MFTSTNALLTFGWPKKKHRVCPTRDLKTTDSDQDRTVGSKKYVAVSRFLGKRHCVSGIITIRSCSDIIRPSQITKSSPDAKSTKRGPYKESTMTDKETRKLLSLYIKRRFLSDKQHAQAIRDNVFGEIQHQYGFVNLAPCRTPDDLFEMMDNAPEGISHPPSESDTSAHLGLLWAFLYSLDADPNAFVDLIGTVDRFVKHHTYTELGPFSYAMIQIKTDDGELTNTTRWGGFLDGKLLYSVAGVYCQSRSAGTSVFDAAFVVASLLAAYSIAKGFRVDDHNWIEAQNTDCTLNASVLSIVRRLYILLLDKIATERTKDGRAYSTTDASECDRFYSIGQGPNSTCSLAAVLNMIVNSWILKSRINTNALAKVESADRLLQTIEKITGDEHPDLPCILGMDRPIGSDNSELYWLLWEYMSTENMDGSPPPRCMVERTCSENNALSMFGAFMRMAGIRLLPQCELDRNSSHFTLGDTAKKTVPSWPAVECVRYQNAEYTNNLHIAMKAAAPTHFVGVFVRTSTGGPHVVVEIPCGTDDETVICDSNCMNGKCARTKSMSASELEKYRTRHPSNHRIFVWYHETNPSLSVVRYTLILKGVFDGHPGDTAPEIWLGRSPSDPSVFKRAYVDFIREHPDIRDIMQRSALRYLASSLLAHVLDGRLSDDDWINIHWKSWYPHASRIMGYVRGVVLGHVHRVFVAAMRHSGEASIVERIGDMFIRLDTSSRFPLFGDTTKRVQAFHRMHNIRCTGNNKESTKHRRMRALSRLIYTEKRKSATNCYETANGAFEFITEFVATMTRIVHEAHATNQENRVFQDLGTWWFDYLQDLGDECNKVFKSSPPDVYRLLVQNSIIGKVVNRLLYEFPLTRLGLPEIYVIMVTFRMPSLGIKFKEDILDELDGFVPNSMSPALPLTGGALAYADTLRELPATVWDYLNERYESQSAYMLDPIG